MSLRLGSSSPSSLVLVLGSRLGAGAGRLAGAALAARRADQRPGQRRARGRPRLRRPAALRRARAGPAAADRHLRRQPAPAGAAARRRTAGCSPPPGPSRRRPPPAWFARLAATRTIAPVALAGPAGGDAAVELRPVYANDIAAVWPEFLDLAAGAGRSPALAARCWSGWSSGGRCGRCGAVGEVLPRIGAGDYAARAPERGPPELVRPGARRQRDGRATGRHADAQPRAGGTDPDPAGRGARRHRPRPARRDRPAPVRRQCRRGHDRQPVARGPAPRRRWSRSAPIQAAIGHMQRLVRDILGRLRPTQLVELGLAGGDRDLIAFWRARRPEIAFETALAARRGRLPEPCRRPLYRLVQESLSNAVRHGAPEPHRGDRRAGRRGDLRGRGAQRRRGAAAQAAAPGFGLTGMRRAGRGARAGRFAAGPARRRRLARRRAACRWRRARGGGAA